MYYYVWVGLSHFYTSELTKPTVITSNGLVVESTPCLTRKGIIAGLSVKIARALTECREFIELDTRLYQSQADEWMNYLTSFSDEIEIDGQSAAWINLSKHPDPESTLKLLLMTLGASLSSSFKFGVGCSKWLAKASANYAYDARSVQSPAQYLSDKSIKCLSVLPDYVLDKLLLLGYHTCGQLQTLPYKVLVNQFGTLAQLIQQSSHGLHIDVIEPIFPRSAISVSHEFELPIDELDSIQELLPELALSLAVKLSEQAMYGNQIVIHLQSESHKRLTIQRVFNRTLFSTQGILWAIRVLIDGQMFQETKSIQILMPNLSHRSELQQSFNSARRMDIDNALHQIHATYGASSVVLAKELQPEWRRIFLKKWVHTLGIS